MNTATFLPRSHGLHLHSGIATLGDGARIAYRFDGDADRPVLMLSNSIATNLSMWDGVVPALTRDFRVLRYDMRGHGASSVMTGAYSPDRLGRDAVELLDALGLDRVHFLGLSLGGIVGQWLGIHAGERIDRLILSNTAPYLGPAPQWDEAIATLADARDMHSTADKFLHNWFPADMLAKGGAVVEAFRSMVLGTHPQGLAGAYAAVRDTDMRRTCSLIERPTLVIGGDHDVVTTARHAEQIAAAIPGARLVQLPTAHLPNVERPKDYLWAVTGFLLGD
jgi:3-oxoadipate enol-lactonase